ncbi:MAG: hypothetical protein ACREMF_00390 [Gemmatimonadales bacterium]
MDNRAEAGHVPLWLLVLLLLLGLALILCLIMRPAGASPTAAPSFTMNVDSVSRDSILAYAISLHYDTVSGAGDEQRLMVGSSCPGTCTYGPLARIEPQSGSHAADTADLAAGRIIARIITTDSAYPKLGLRGGFTTYWWVDKKGPENNWRSVMVPAYQADTLVHRGLELHEADTAGDGYNYEWKQSIARFYWKDTDELPWGTCTSSRCCR